MYSNSRETYKKSDLHKNLTNFVDWITKRHQECGGITEIRILKDNRAYSGYYDYENREKLIEAVLPSANPRKKIPFGDYPRIGEGNIYFTLNAVDKDLLARSAYEIKNVSATSDSDIVAYQLFAIDVDPVRKSGISSTDEEKKHALEVIDSVQQWLKEKGINSLLADSGNGYHLLVPTIQYKEEKVFEASKKAHLLLKRLDVLFSTDKAKIDTNIYNPSRIFKLYGTLAMKGSNTQERPYRWSQIDMSALPEDIDIFEILKEEIDTSSLSESKSETRIVVDSEGWSSSDSISILEGVLSAEGIPYKRKKKETRELFVFEKCPHHKEDDGHEYECCIIVEANGKYGASCKHDSIAGWQEFKSVIGWYKHIDDVKKKLELTDDEQFKSKQQAQELIDLVKGSEFFYNSRKEPFITTKVNDHFENLNLRKEDFKTFLKGLFWKKKQKSS